MAWSVLVQARGHAYHSGAHTRQAARGHDRFGNKRLCHLEIIEVGRSRGLEAGPGAVAWRSQVAGTSCTRLAFTRSVCVGSTAGRS